MMFKITEPQLWNKETVITNDTLQQTKWKCTVVTWSRDRGGFLCQVPCMTTMVMLRFL